MPVYKENKRRKGFTLIELLIVIFIVGIVYGLGFSKIEINKSEAKALTPLNLKSVLLKSGLFNKKATLLCINNCKSCFLRKNLGEEYQDYESGIDLQNIKAYTIDKSDTLVRLRYERYKDEPICLKIDFYPNGSSTQLILKDQKGSYFLPSYFEEPQKFESVEDAKDYWLEHSKLVSDNGEFY
ncbi:hypothetical protein MNB_SV-13-772 [hydrothermal vent metagenome]|uniref:Type II secretion envelope pseudopilin protein (PulG,guides folded protein to PulD in outer membrane) n=1 Tax=hydrothermal vent metagenome TaxID=652676 RepID=A0A1W1CZ94_9ZZZZ